MSKIRITKKFDFETAHALFGYDGKCKNIHGHSYKLYVTVIGTPINNPNEVKHGMVIDFGDLKRIVQKQIVEVFDHTVILNQLTEHKQLGQQLIEQGHTVVFVNYQPTSENMITDFANRIKANLPEKVELFSLRLQETESSYAEWFSTDN